MNTPSYDSRSTLQLSRLTPHQSRITDHSSRIALRDGRRLGYAEYGDLGGAPVFYFHGMPGSRLQRHPDPAVASDLGVRVITCDRPGYGLSDFQTGRRLLDWPRDVTQLADALGIERFAVLGVSGGGPHAAACAYALPERVTRAGIVSSPRPLGGWQDAAGMSSLARLALGIGARAPLLLRPVVWALSNPGRNSEQFVLSSARYLPPADQAVLQRAAFRAMMIEDSAEAGRRGVRAYWWDLALLTRPWGFDLGGIHVPVHLWHGEADNIVPAAMGHYLAAAIRTCQASFLPGEGHFLVFNHLWDILRVLVAPSG